VSAKRYKFRAKIEGAGADDSGGACVLFPFDLKQEFGIARVPVKALLDGVPYTGSLIRYGRPEPMLPILKAVREQIGKKVGDTISVELWQDMADRKVETPAAFAALLKREKVLDFFDSLSNTHRKEYIRWVTEAKKEETRERRLAKSVEMLRAKIKTPG
jgi:bacteriocin resistance YdeI/OmpD-like protein/uncharacterized protein DUF1905